MSDTHVLKMPIKRFWMMNGNIERVQAQRDIRTLSVVASAQSGEMAQETRDGLLGEMGTVAISAPERDEQGFTELKDMMKVM